MKVVSAKIIDNKPCCPNCGNVLGIQIENSYKQIITENGESLTMFNRYCNTPTKICNINEASYLVDIADNIRWEVGEFQEVKSEESK